MDVYFVAEDLIYVVVEDESGLDYFKLNTFCFLRIQKIIEFRAQFQFQTWFNHAKFCKKFNYFDQNPVVGNFSQHLIQNRNSHYKKALIDFGYFVNG